MICINHEVIYNINGLTSFSLKGNDKFVNSLRYINYKQPDKLGRTPDFDIAVGPFKPDLENCLILDDKYYIKYNYIYCKDKYKSLSWEIEIKNFEDEDSPTSVRINIKHEALFSRIAYSMICVLIIDSMIYYSLISKGFAPVHASCASKDDKAYIFTGRSGAGKTSVILRLIKNGYKYVNDDIVILCPGNVAVGFVKSLNIFAHNIDDQFYNNLSFSDKIKLRIFNIIYKLSNEYIKIFTHINPIDTFHGDVDKRELDIKSLFLLMPKKGSEKINRYETSKGDIISHICHNQSIEMYYLGKYFLAYSYVYPNTSLVNVYDRYKDNLKKNLDRPKFYKIDVPMRYNDDLFSEISRMVSNS